MRPLRSILLFFALVLIGGALLAPWVYFLAHWAASHLPGCASWANVPFHRFVHRCFILAALAALPWFLRSLGVADLRDLCQALKPPRWTSLVSGAATGFFSLALVVTVALLAGTRGWRPGHTFSEAVRTFGGALATACLVALLEESLFRWALFGTLKKVYTRGFAIFLSSAIYAIVHFFSRPAPPTQVTWLSGLALLPRMLRGFGDWHALFPGFFNLFLIGSILALAYDRSGSLWFSIGLHGGWILWLKSYGFWTVQSGSGAAWFWGTEKLIDGLMATFVLILTAVIVKLALNRMVPPRNTLS